MDPWDLLAARVVAQLPGVNVIPGPAQQVQPDAIVIRADEPWMVHEDAAYKFQPERYVALAASRVSDPASSFHTLYQMAKGVQAAASDEGWDWVDVSGVSLDETTGVPLLVVATRVTYKSPTNGG